jgi:hypothetical protein
MQRLCVIWNYVQIAHLVVLGSLGLERGVDRCRG